MFYEKNNCKKLCHYIIINIRVDYMLEKMFLDYGFAKEEIIHELDSDPSLFLEM